MQKSSFDYENVLTFEFYWVSNEVLLQILEKKNKVKTYTRCFYNDKFTKIAGIEIVIY